MAPTNILLVDAVPWTDNHPLGHPLRDVTSWFLPYLAVSESVSVRTLSAEADLAREPSAEVHGVIISGSPRDAWSEDPVNLALCDLIQRSRQRSVPLLGVCYGHQVLGRALGGLVGLHPQGWELGNVGIELTPDGACSPLFADFPKKFTVLQSHADAVLNLPPGCRLLASGNHTAVQAFSWNNSLFGVQFHPETNPEIVRFLWHPRRDRWRGKIGFDLDQRLADLQPTPIASRVFANFLNHVNP